MDTETQVDQMQNLPAALLNSSSSSISMKLYRCNYLLNKRSLQLVITLSLFSLLICLSSIGNSSRYVVVYLNPLFTRSLERKYMFLICNAILAFLATTSATRKTTTASTASDDHYREYDAVNSVGCEDTAMFEGASDEETEGRGELGEEGDEDDNGSNDDDDVDEVGDEECGKYNAEFEEEGKEEGRLEMEVKEEGGKSEEMVGYSTEELNRKIEDFIRKMKQEMRIESQQPLVTAA